MQTKLHKTMRITLEHSCQIRPMYHLCSVKGKMLTGMFPQYCCAQIYVHTKKPLADGTFLIKKIKQGKTEEAIQARSTQCYSHS